MGSGARRFARRAQASNAPSGAGERVAPIGLDICKDGGVRFQCFTVDFSFHLVRHQSEFFEESLSRRKGEERGVLPKSLLIGELCRSMHAFILKS